MICTKIEFGKKGVVVHSDESSFFLHPKKVLEYGIEVGSDFDFHQIQRESEELFACDQALFYLARADKTGFQVKRYLLEKGYGEEICESVVKTLKDLKYVDDWSYALRYQQEKSKTHGQYYIVQKLREKGISSTELSRLESKEDPKLMASLLRKKYAKREVDYAFKGKMARFLQSRGFSAENTYKAVDIYENMQDEDCL